jgi:transposase-like protein
MKRTRHTAELIIRKLKSAEQLIAQGKTVADVCRVIEVTQPIYHRWRGQCAGMQAEEARRLTQLEKENARLKKLLAMGEAGLPDHWRAFRIRSSEAMAHPIVGRAWDRAVGSDCSIMRQKGSREFTCPRCAG